MIRKRATGAMAAALLTAAACAGAAGTDAPECVAPAKIGGGFDFTCRLFKDLVERSGATRQPVRISYVPGGIGAVAYDRAVTQKSADPSVVTAFSSGSLLNIAQGKFGPHDERAVRWLAALGTDYGVLAVRRNSPVDSLADLMVAIRRDPSRVAFGAGGTVGSQDWIKAALLVKASERDFRAMRFVSFEGGGEALAALKGGHVEVFCGDASEIRASLAEPGGGGVKIIAVLSEGRLPGYLAGVRTAREQGLDLVWPTVRGVYLGPGVSDAEYAAWTGVMQRALGHADAQRLRDAQGIFPLSLTGGELEDFVRRTTRQYRELAGSLRLRVAPAK